MEVYAFGVELLDPDAEETLFVRFEDATGFGQRMYLSGLEDDDREEGFGQSLRWCGVCDEHADRFMLVDMQAGDNTHTFYYVRKVTVFGSADEAMPAPRHST